LFDLQLGAPYLICCNRITKQYLIAATPRVPATRE
jgi:hypothetical protein